MLFCLTLVATACTSSKNIVKLSGIKWELQSINGKAIQLKDNSSEVFIQFNETEKRANGRAGCNRFFGNYEMDGDLLKFSPMGATRMACPDLEIESDFFKMIELVDHFSIKNNQLLFMQKGKVLAEFKKGEELKNESKEK